MTAIFAIASAVFCVAVWIALSIHERCATRQLLRRRGGANRGEQ